MNATSSDTLNRSKTIRRHLEELDPGWETQGDVSFFGVAVELQSQEVAGATGRLFPILDALIHDMVSLPAHAALASFFLRERHAERVAHLGAILTLATGTIHAARHQLGATLVSFETRRAPWRTRRRSSPRRRRYRDLRRACHSPGCRSGHRGAPSSRVAPQKEGTKMLSSSSDQTLVARTLSDAVDATLRRLREGNQRYRAHVPHSSAPRRPRPRPLAAVISCSDFHVAPEALFDLDVGELLVLPTPAIRISMSEAAACNLAHQWQGIDLAIVLGHTGCPTMEAVRLYGMEGGLLTRLVAHELGDVGVARTGDDFEVCMCQRMADRLRELLAEPREVAVLPAIFDARTRGVEFLGVA